jgi:phosphoglycolate phosphatase
VFSLAKLLDYDDVVIQCHDYPDADALASAFAVYTYLKSNGKTSRMIYSGRAEISKPNLLKMIGLFSMPIEYVKVMSPMDVLVLVDCQYGESNVTHFDARCVFQLDHHTEKENGHDGIIRSYLGSCATVIWDMLEKENFPFEKYPHVITALYYGLFTDTNSFEEIAHPLDKDMRDELAFDRAVFNTLRFNNLTIEDLDTAGIALTRHVINEENGFAIFHADACDRNILGFISDLSLQLEDVDMCIVYNVLPEGYQISIRSCTREIMAGEFAEFLAFGGGHRQKAGGFISHDKVSPDDISEYIQNRTKEYFNSYDIIYSDSHNLDISAMGIYEKRVIPLGFVLSTDIFPKGTPMLIRTLEGDSDISAADDVLLMIGIEGETYPISVEKFAKSYALTDRDFIKDYAYSPTVKNKMTGEVMQLTAHAKACIPMGQTQIYATPIHKNTKVFNSWNPEGYMLGITGDYIAVRCDDFKDVYIIKNDIFAKTYDDVRK